MQREGQNKTVAPMDDCVLAIIIIMPITQLGVTFERFACSCEVLSHLERATIKTSPRYIEN